jgi:hypothetical protein
MMSEGEDLLQRQVEIRVLDLGLDIVDGVRRRAHIRLGSWT